MSRKFSSSSTAAMFRLIGALFTALFCLVGTGFVIWGVTCFGSHWLLLPVVGLPLAISAVVFALGTRTNWYDWRRYKMLDGHRADITDILSGHLSVYHRELGRPWQFQFEPFLHWLDRNDSSLDTGQILDALIELERIGQLERHYPEEGGLYIRLLPEFRQRQVFAIAPQVKRM